MRLNIKYNNGKAFIIRANLISAVSKGGSNILRVYSYKPPVSVDSVKYTLENMYGIDSGENEEVLNMALADIGSFRMPTEFKTELMKNLSTEFVRINLAEVESVTMYETGSSKGLTFYTNGKNRLDAYKDVLSVQSQINF